MGGCSVEPIEVVVVLVPDWPCADPPTVVGCSAAPMVGTAVLVPVRCGFLATGAVPTEVAGGSGAGGCGAAPMGLCIT